MSKAEYDDPVYRHTRREAISILVLWGLCLLWVVTSCYLYGYRQDPSQPLQTIWGMPAWVFWGVAVPWFAASVVGIAMAMWWIHEDDLGEVSDLAEGGPAAREGHRET